MHFLVNTYSVWGEAGGPILHMNVNSWTENVTLNPLTHYGYHIYTQMFRHSDIGILYEQWIFEFYMILKIHYFPEQQ